ncbi:hypothetical protein [Streptomyces sp. NBC_01304]|uniref:hypothetical protein n=1 Tax=Streptomyces sp. NBC_01304 TaxID=2903818 RepID=UPI002E10A924|nr:hypothetical protein OG430_00165 [Streptomyces sp. NBC_01304]WSJ90864.1 hypothetical protein OG430_47345 [Streptomyces sp. NBC_01304]
MVYVGLFARLSQCGVCVVISLAMVRGLAAPHTPLRHFGAGETAVLRVDAARQVDEGDRQWAAFSSALEDLPRALRD